jgi:hypothetical protein
VSYPNRGVFLSKNEQENIRKMLGPAMTISEYLGKAAKYFKEGKGLAKSLAESAPWLKDVADAAGAATPIIGVRREAGREMVGVDASLRTRRSRLHAGLSGRGARRGRAGLDVDASVREPEHHQLGPLRGDSAAWIRRFSN